MGSCHLPSAYHLEQRACTLSALCHQERSEIAIYLRCILTFRFVSCLIFKEQLVVEEIISAIVIVLYLCLEAQSQL